MNKQQLNGVPSALGAAERSSDERSEAERSGAVPKAGPTSPPNPLLARCLMRSPSTSTHCKNVGNAGQVYEVGLPTHSATGEAWADGGTRNGLEPMRKHRTGKLSASFNIECYILTMKFFIFTDMVINLSEVESIADVQGSSSVLFFRSGRQVVLSDKARQDIGAALKGNGMTIPSSATS